MIKFIGDIALHLRIQDPFSDTAGVPRQLFFSLYSSSFFLRRKGGRGRIIAVFLAKEEERRLIEDFEETVCWLRG